MKNRHTTRNAILHYLQVTGGRRVAVIIEYMRRHYGTEPHATEVALSRLAAKGKLSRPRRGFYQWV